MSISGRVLRGTAFISGATLLARVGTFLANLAIIRLLGREGIGQLGLIESWLGVTTLFSLAGVGVGLTKFVSQYWKSDNERSAGITATALLVATLMSLGVGVGVYLCIGLGLWKHEQIGVLFRANCLLFLALILVVSLKQTVTNVIYGFQEFSSLVRANIAVGIFSFPVSFLLVKMHGLQGALESRLLLAVIELAWLGWAMGAVLRREKAPLHLREMRRDGKELLLFGLPTFIGQLASNPVQPFMLTFLASQPGGLAQVGLITIAQRLVALVNFLPGSMSSTLIPVLSSEWGSGSASRFRESALATLRLCWLCTLPIVVFFAAASPFVLSRLYGQGFSAAWPTAFILLLIALLGSLNETADRSFIAAGRVWLSTSNNFVWLALFVPLAWYLIPAHGARGYVVGFLFTFELYVTLQMWWLYRLFRVDTPALFPMVFTSAALLSLSWMVAAAHQWAWVGALVLTALTLLLEVRYFLTASEQQALARRFQNTGLGRRIATRLVRA